MIIRTLTLVLAALAASASLAAAQPAPGGRVVGTVESVDGSTLVVRRAVGGTARVELTEKAAVFGLREATLADIKPNSFVGVGAMPQPDGSQMAIQIIIFAESQRGTGEGHRPWDRPGTTMTNATVDTTVGAVAGNTLTVKYKGGEQRIIVPPEATIRAYEAATRADLKPGANVAVVGSAARPDGTVESSRVNVGVGAVVPQ